MTEATRSMSARVRRGGIWSLFGHISGIAIRLGTNLILARLLTPAAFGVSTIAMTMIVGLNMFSDLGLRPFLMQSARGREPKVMNTVWSVQVSRGLIIAGLTVLLAIALWVAQQQIWVDRGSAFGDATLPFIMVILALVPALGGFESTRVLEAQRRLDIGAVTRMNMTAQSASVIVLIIAAYLLRSVWALPIGAITSACVIVAYSHFLLRGHPNRFELERDILPDVLRFGRWIVLSSMVGFFANNLDRLILGSAMSATQLGIYGVAATAVAMITEGLGKLLGDLAMPAFSEIHLSRPHDLRAAHYRFRKPFDIACFVATGGLVASGGALVHFLYDARYATAGWMVAILACGIPALRSRVTSSLLMATGDSESQFHLALAGAMLLAACAGMGLRLDGMRGFLIGVTIAPYLVMAISFYKVQRMGLIDWWAEVRWAPAVLLGYGLGLIAARLLNALPHFR